MAYEILKVRGRLICFNPLNGSVIELDKKEFEMIKKDKSNLDKNEQKIQKKITRCLEKGPIKPEGNRIFNFQWHITDVCNLRCNHCYMTTYKDNGLKFYKLKKIARDCINSSKLLGYTPEFSITGGEPLLSKNVFKLIKFIKEKCPSSQVSILTNGTLINDKIIEKLKLSKIDKIQVSLESSKKNINDSIRGKNNFDKVVNSIGLIRKANIPINMHFVLSKRNSSDVIPYLKLCKDLGATTVTISNLVPMGTGKQMETEILSPKELKQTYTQIIKFVKNNPKYSSFINTNRPIWCNFDKEKTHKIGGYCPVGFNTLTILPNGDALPCRRLNLKIGNLTKKSFFQIWYGSKILWDLRDQEKLIGCGKCKNLENCGGCRALAHAFSNNYMGPDPQCWIINRELGDPKKSA